MQTETSTKVSPNHPIPPKKWARLMLGKVWHSGWFFLCFLHGGWAFLCVLVILSFFYPQKPDPEQQPVSSLPSRVMGWGWRSIWGLSWWTIRFAVLFLTVFKIPMVQNWMAHQAATFLSSELKTKVEIGQVELALFNQAILREVYIEDLTKDTLLYAKELQAFFSVRALWEKQHLNLDKVELNDAVFNYERLEGTRDFNLYFLLRYFGGSGKKDKKASIPPQISLTQVSANRLRFNYIDVAAGTEVRVFAPHLFLYSSSDSTSLAQKFVRADSLYLNDAEVNVRQFKKIPMPPKPSTAEGNPDTSKPDTTTPYWNLGAEKLRLANIHFKMRNENQPIRPERDLDFADLDVKKINLDIDAFRMYREKIQGQVKRLSAREKRGFEVTKMQGYASVSPKQIAVTKFRLETPHSSIADSLFFDYSAYTDFYDFVNKVKIEGHLKNSTLRLRDIIAFAPVLKNSPFFAANANRPIEVSGHIKGIINNLKTRDVRLRLGRNTELRGGYLSLNDITISDAGFLDMSLEHVQTSYADLVDLLPFAKIPSQLQRLGLLTFKGNYAGYFQDFVAYGQLRTDLGTAQTDLKMNLRGGATGAVYSGSIRLADFALGKLLDQSEIGKVGFRANLNGRGLTAATFDVDLDNAYIDSFAFRSYIYRNILVDGRARYRQFEGEIRSDDRNCNLFFSGSADLRDSLPKINLDGRIGELNFQKLYLSPKPFNLQLDSFAIRAVGDDLANLKGSAHFKNLNLQRFGKSFHLDSILLLSQDSIRPRRINFGNSFDSTRLDTVHYVKIFSDILYMRVAGLYDAQNLPRSLARHVQKFYPNLFKNLQKIEALRITELARVDSLRPSKEQRFRLQLRMDSSRNFTQLIDTSFKDLMGVKIHAYFNSFADTLHINANASSFKYQNLDFQDINIAGGGRERVLALTNKFSSLLIGETTRLPAFEFKLQAQGDTVNFATEISKIGEVASNISLAGQLSFMSRMLEINLDSAHVTILNRPWTIRGDNYIRVGSGKLDVRNVKFTNQNQLVELSSVGTRGLGVCVQKMQLAWLYELVKIPQLDITGSFSADVKIADIFNQKELAANVYFDSLHINKDHWGYSSLRLHSDSLFAPIYSVFQHKSELVDTFWAVGAYTPTFRERIPAQNQKNRQELDFWFGFEKAKVRILQYFLPTQLSNLAGHINLKEGRLFGQPKDLHLGGRAWLREFATKVNFLNTSYTVDSAEILLLDEGFQLLPRASFDANGAFLNTALSGVVVKDEKGNPAKIWGGILHDNFKNFRLDLHFHLDNNLVLNTSSKDNTTFYGKVFADGEVAFTGAFNQLKLNIDGVSRDSTFLVLPLGDPLQVDEVKYITFVDKKKAADNPNEPVKKVNTGGISIELNVEIRPEAVLQMLFDEQTGELMQGQGQGNLRMTYNPSGEFAMYGDLEILKGNYLFTYKNITQKNFIVRPGGTITWTGDPYEAQLNIQAAYKQKAGLYNLISSYIETAEASVKQSANNPTDVDLLMNIQGLLFSPNITFDINIQNPPTQLRSFTDLALKAVRDNKNELNRQVFGLVLMQQFLPLENNNGRGQAVDVLSSGFNTISEFLSQQISNYLTDLFKGVVDEVGFISSFEIDVDMKMRDQSTTNIATTRNSGVNVGIDQKWFDDRLRLRMGANMDLGNSSTGNVNGANQNYIGGDFIMEYQITDDGRLKARMYNRTESNILGRVSRTGIGLSYRKEFNSFGELYQDIKKDIADRRFKRQLRKEKRRAKKAAPDEILPNGG